jgi:hypothetical protein
MRTLKVNTLSVFLAIKYASEVMKKQVSGGSIIATASVAGIRAGAGGTDYSASKAAVINLVQTSAWQLYGTNVRGIILPPGSPCPSLHFSFLTSRLLSCCAFLCSLSYSLLPICLARMSLNLGDIYSVPESLFLAYKSQRALPRPYRNGHDSPGLRHGPRKGNIK